MKNNEIIPSKSNLKRQARRINDSHFDRVWKFYFNNETRIQLSEHEEGLRQRWEHAWSLMGKILTTRQVVKKQVKKFGIHIDTAYEDLKNAKKLFGDSGDQMKKAKREIVSIWLEKAIKKASDAEDWRAVEKLILRYSRINGLDQGDGDEVAEIIKKLKPHTIVICGDPNSLKQEADELMEGADDLPESDYEIIPDED